MVDLLWDDGAPGSARNIIHKYVGSLRRLLEPGLAARASGSYLQARGDGYVFQGRGSGLDLLAFRDLVAQAQAADANRQEQGALDRLVRALGLWRGPTADGLRHGPRAGAFFVALDNEYYDACLTAADISLRLEQPQRVLAALRRAASMAPLNEEVLAALATTLGAAGRRAEALGLLRTVRVRLIDELGMDPGPALRDAQQRVLDDGGMPAAKSAASADQSAGFSEPADLVGRRVEFGVLRSVVQPALSGGTGVATIDGEPGVGKTHLLRAASEHTVELGGVTVWGTGIEGKGAPSMWPWIKVVGSLLELLPVADRESWLATELGQLLEPAKADDVLAMPDSGSRFRLFERVVALAGRVAARDPVVIIIDDLHWADVASLELFGHLAARLPAGTVLIGALRDRSPAPGTALSRVLAEVSRVPVHRRIHLDAMSESEVAELVRRDTGVSIDGVSLRRILERTSGNPFFVRELARLLSATTGLTPTGISDSGVPPTVHEIVRTRIGNLSADAMRLLETAALVGRSAEIDLLAEANGLDLPTCLDLLEPLAALGVLEPAPSDPRSFRFPHDLVRQSIVHVTPPRRAIEVHQRIADALDVGAVDDGSATERLAYHLVSAGSISDPSRTSAALLQAGRRAVATSAFESAEQHLLAAIDVARKAGLADVELSAAGVLATVSWRQLVFSGSYTELLTRAEQLARELGQDSKAADFLFMRVIAAFSQHDADTDLLARRLVAFSEASGDSTARMYAHHITSLILFDQGDFGGALDQLREDDWTPAAYARWGRENPLRRDLRFSPLSRALTLMVTGDVEAARHLFQTLEDAAGDEPYAITVWAHWATTAVSWAGDPSWALHIVTRWRKADPHHQFAVVDSYLRVVQCWARALTGDDASAEAAEAARVIEQMMLPLSMYGTTLYLCLLAEMWLAAGLPVRASRALDTAERFAAANGEPYTLCLRLLLRARVLSAEGAPTDLVRAAVQRAHSVSTAQAAELIARRTTELMDHLPLDD
jgi:DNA-binding SARP family transcriptional activator